MLLTAKASLLFVSQSTVSNCKQLCLDFVVSRSVIVGTLTWVLWQYFVLITGLFRGGFCKDGSHSARSGRNLDLIGKKGQWRSYPEHAHSTGHHPYSTGHYYYFDPILQNLSRHSNNYNPTRQRISRMLRDAPDCRECLADLSWPFPIRRTLLRTYTTAFRQG